MLYHDDRFQPFLLKWIVSVYMSITFELYSWFYQKDFSCVRCQQCGRARIADTLLSLKRDEDREAPGFPLLLAV